MRVSLKQTAEIVSLTILGFFSVHLAFALIIGGWKVALVMIAFPLLTILPVLFFDWLRTALDFPVSESASKAPTQRLRLVFAYGLGVVLGIGRDLDWI